MYRSEESHQQNNSQRENIINKKLSESILSTASLSAPGYEVKMPAISQPLLSRYRGERPKKDLLSNKKWDINIFIDFFCGTQSNSTVSMCQKCPPSEHSNLCSFILQMISQKYDWKSDPKFKSTYQSYNKKKIPIFLTDQEIENRLVSKCNILGVILMESHKQLLMRIIKNYIKHTIYYGQEKRLSLENDYYFWFLIGIYYHVGVPKYFNDLQMLPKDLVGVHEPMMFWLLQSVMKKLNICTEENLNKVKLNTLQYSRFFYSKQCKTLCSYGIDLEAVFGEWVSEGMMGYMGIEFIGFYIKCLLKEGFEYMQKTVMSYFDNRNAKLEMEGIVEYHEKSNVGGGVSNRNMSDENQNMKKQQIMKILMDSKEVWSGIFFQTNAYNLKE